jgi:hypothetical protein
VLGGQVVYRFTGERPVKGICVVPWESPYLDPEDSRFFGGCRSKLTV